MGGVSTFSNASSCPDLVTGQREMVGAGGGILSQVGQDVLAHIFDSGREQGPPVGASRIRVFHV